jgi:hypothetical protein
MSCTCDKKLDKNLEAVLMGPTSIQMALGYFYMMLNKDNGK